jgi:hypothetical protein
MSNHDPFDLRGQERAEEEAEERAMRALQLEIEAIKWVMSDKRGRRFVAKQLERTGAFRLSFNTNALTMAFNEGMRSVGLMLMSLLNEHCPERYSEMLKENKESKE